MDRAVAGTGAEGKGDLAKAGQGYDLGLSCFQGDPGPEGPSGPPGPPGKPVSVLRPLAECGWGRTSLRPKPGVGTVRVRCHLHTSFLRAALEPFRAWKAARISW